MGGSDGSWRGSQGAKTPARESQPPFNLIHVNSVWFIGAGSGGAGLKGRLFGSRLCLHDTSSRGWDCWLASMYEKK